MLSTFIKIKPAQVAGLLIGLSLGQAVWAQTLAQAVDAAWARYPQAVAMTARQAQAQAQGDQARGLTPGAGAVSLSQLTDKLNRNQGAQEWEVEVSTPLWLPGQRAAREVEAGHAAAEVTARSAALRLQLAGEVREAWWAIAAARETHVLASQRLVTAQVLEQTVVRRFKAGDLARQDANLAKTERLAAQAEVLDTENALRLAQEAYQALTGAQAPQVLAPEASPAAMASVDHPQSQALQAAAALARSRLGLVSVSRREAPELALSWSSQRGNATEPYAQMVGVKLTVPLSSEGRVRQEGAAAGAELAQAEAELAMTQARVQQALARAQAELQTAERQGAMAEERRALSLDNLRLAERSFELGESDLPTLMRARAAEHESAAWFKRQEVAGFLARSRLLQAQGVLP